MAAVILSSSKLPLLVISVFYSAAVDVFELTVFKNNHYIMGITDEN